MKEKKTPLRMCLGCNQMLDKKELLRIVRDKEGNISVDLTGKKAGRGAYICQNSDCFKKLQKSRRLERTFSTKISDEIYEALAKEIADAG